MGDFEGLSRKSQLGRLGRIFFLLSALLLISEIARAQSLLAGTVVGRDDRPKARVSVDLLGASTVYARTDDSGKFVVRLRPGRYVIRVRDYQRRYEFTQDIMPGQNSGRYVLPW